MEPLIAPLAGLLAACGTYLMLSGHLLRLVFGVALLGSAANLAVFAGGRLTEYTAPLIPEGATLPDTVIANPLPQALVLTAIVIGFGFAAFALAIALAANRRLGTVDPEAMRIAEADPDDAPAKGATASDRPNRHPAIAQPARGVRA
ncbi:MAG: NADH-quinone oxidoreductase subunit K [Pseudomonadota bacterium]